VDARRRVSAIAIDRDVLFGSVTLAAGALSLLAADDEHVTRTFYSEARRQRETAHRNSTTSPRLEQSRRTVEIDPRGARRRLQ